MSKSEWKSGDGRSLALEFVGMLTVVAVIFSLMALVMSAVALSRTRPLPVDAQLFPLPLAPTAAADGGTDQIIVEPGTMVMVRDRHGMPVQFAAPEVCGWQYVVGCMAPAGIDQIYIMLPDGREGWRAVDADGSVYVGEWE